jgi:hypothetical protein
MSVTLFGSCRINGIKNNNNLNSRINYTHSTKEVIQQIKFLLGELSLPSPFDRLCFRTGIVDNKSIIYNHDFKRLYNESTLCVVEICSGKKYMYDDFYLHHMCVDKRIPDYKHNTPQLVLDNFKCIKQTPAEIENDILEIKKLIEPRKLLVVTHYNPKINGNYIESRNWLVTVLTEICEKHNILMINPTEALKSYIQEEVLYNDMEHYTDFGLSKISEYLNDYIDNNILLR